MTDQYDKTPSPTPTDRVEDAYKGQDNMLKSTQSLLYHPNSTGSGDDSTAYDPLGRETAYRQGTLSAGGNNGAVLDTVTTAVNSAGYSLDALGNQAAVNSQNELTGSLLAYNNDGDQTENPAGGGYCTCDTYDAWNELVSYSSPSPSGTTCETMGYDALGREISDNYSPASGGSAAENKYYSPSGQVLQDTCVCTTGAGCGCGCGCTCTTTTDNFVWAPDYVNDLVLRDRTISGTTTRLYAQHDANFDVTALVNTSGTVTERLAYDPYGNVTVLTGAWGGSSDNTWQVRFQGMWLDNTTALYNTPNRNYSASEVRWIEADPAGYVDGLDLYQLEKSAPATNVDPGGSATAKPFADGGGGGAGTIADEIAKWRETPCGIDVPTPDGSQAFDGYIPVTGYDAVDILASVIAQGEAERVAYADSPEIAQKITIALIKLKHKLKNVQKNLQDPASPCYETPPPGRGKPTPPAGSGGGAPSAGAGAASGCPAQPNGAKAGSPAPATSPPAASPPSTTPPGGGSNGRGMPWWFIPFIARPPLPMGGGGGGGELRSREMTPWYAE